MCEAKFDRPFYSVCFVIYRCQTTRGRVACDMPARPCKKHIAAMNSLLNDYAAGILRTPEPPCISLYQPTHRHHPDKQQNPIRFRNLVKALEESLRQKYSTRDVRPLLEPLQNLAEDHSFWNHSLDGLALLAAPACSGFTGCSAPSPSWLWSPTASISSRSFASFNRRTATMCSD
jgi:hypothetical protein